MCANINYGGGPQRVKGCYTYHVQYLRNLWRVFGFCFYFAYAMIFRCSKYDFWIPDEILDRHGWTFFFSEMFRKYFFHRLKSRKIFLRFFWISIVKSQYKFGWSELKNSDQQNLYWLLTMEIQKIFFATLVDEKNIF